MRIIATKRGEIKKLGQMFGVTTRTVNNALSGRTDSAKNRRIRKAALERGALMINTNIK